MEAFFRDDQEIREWVDLFIEKLFTVNLLSGNDADGEFYQGRQAVEKIALSFQEMLNLPNEVLIDGIRQLVEQRLPDHRVIENFPDFYNLMNDMILAGLQNMKANEKDCFPQQIANLKGSQHVEGSSILPSSRIAINGSGALAKEMESSFLLRHHLLKAFDSSIASDSSAENSITEDSPANTTHDSNPKDAIVANSNDLVIREESKENVWVEEIVETLETLEPRQEVIESADPITESLEELIDESIPALSTAITQQKDENPPRDLASLPPRDPFRFNVQKKKNNDAPAEITVKPVTIAQEIPQDGLMLARVLKQLYGDPPIEWNVAVHSLVFYAKVEELLVYLEPHDSPEIAENELSKIMERIIKDNFKIYTCNHEDLAYPRRLERGIRRVKR